MARLEALEKEVSHLRGENLYLRERLAKYEIKKDSGNSSLPPSSDMVRPKKDRSLRTKTGRKPGGQPGRKGRTLGMSAVPDHIEELVPCYCRACGRDLSEVPPAFEGRRQTVDIPPIRAQVTEYRSYSRVCGCGACTVGEFPGHAISPICYGPNVEALAAYLHTRQYLPYKRMAELFRDVLRIPVSQGGIGRLLHRCARKALPAYGEIRSRISVSPVVGSDETGAKVNGKKHWFWTWQTSILTYVAASGTRGRAAVEENFPQGLPGSILVRDGWNPQRNTLAKGHQICLAHLLRDIRYLKERYPGEHWPIAIGSLLADAIALSKEGPPPEHRMAHIQYRLEGLLESPPEKTKKELHTFYRRILKEKDNLFTFLHNGGVPFDNNGSERAIRNVKVKQKISGQFKTEKGARDFAVLRSIIDTTVKNGQNVLETLTLIAKLQPQSIG